MPWKQKNMRMKGGKKAQFYLFIALILIGVAFALASTQITIKKPAPLFRQLHQNFYSEAPNVINNAILYKKNTTAALEQFTLSYHGYAQTRSPGFGMLTIFADDKVFVHNLLGNQVIVNYQGNVALNDKASRVFPRKGTSLVITAYGISYTYAIDEEPVQLHALFRSSNNKDIQIYSTP